MTMTSITITITECYGDRKTTILKARTDDIEVAINRVLAKGYGKGKVFIRDNELSHGSDALRGSQYGQLMRWSESANAHTSVTQRVLIHADKHKPVKGYSILKFTGALRGNSGEKVSSTRKVAIRQYQAWKSAHPGVGSELIAVHADGSDGAVVEA